jgi:hypothetical protein
MADVNSKDSCKTCIYFLNLDFNIGSCRRFPLFQNRSLGEWCGEFSQIAPPPVIQYMVQDIELEAKRVKVLEEAAITPPKPRGRPKKEQA